VLLYELLSGVPSRGVALHLRAALSLDESFPDEVRRAVVAASHPDPAVRPPVAEVRARLAAARDALPTRPDRTRTTTTSSGSGSLRPIAPAGPPTRIGRYDVVRELGRGGAGVVYEATDTELRRRVALKVLLSGTFARARELQRFKQEAQAVARLDHEGIVKVLDIGSHVDGAWFAMEFVDGPSLMDRVRAEGHLGWEEAVRIAAVVARALAHAHGAGLLHRDVKPHNVLLERGREPKLADFGLALAADADVTRLTGTGQILGTPMYMAPEQATGDLRALGPHTDVYALGVTLYESLTGKVPFEGATPLQVIGRILRGNPRPPREHLAALPRSVELAVLKAIRLEPQDRYPTAAAFAEDLERCLRGEPLTAAEPTWGERARWWARANRRALGTASLVAAATLLTAAALYGGAVALARRERSARERTAEEAWGSVQERSRSARESGDQRAVEELFRAYTARPEHAGTRALVRAWWDRARWGGGADQRISALASAYAAATETDDQDESLRLLAEAAREAQRYPLLASVLDTLEQRGSPLLSLPSVRALRRDALSAHHDLAGAAALDPEGATTHGRLLRALAPATAVELPGAAVLPWPGGGLLVIDRGAARLVAAEVDLRPVGPLELPGGVYRTFAWPFELDGAPGLVYRTSASRTSVVRVVDGQVVVELDLDGSLESAAAADLDGDGRVEVYFTVGRELLRGRRTPGAPPGPGAWTIDHPSPETDSANSVLSAIAAWSWGGQPGLAVAVGEWTAYDVRWLRPTAAGALEVAARRKLGTVHRLAVVDHGASLLACKWDGYPNARVFPPAHPTGVEHGMWELSGAPGGSDPLEGGAHRTPHCDVNAVGDFDGDGDDDVATNTPEGVLVQARRPDGGFDEVPIGGLWVAGGAELDGDPAAELLVHQDGHLWVLGAGTGALPRASRAHVAAATPPADADEVFRALWLRAEDLVYLGQLAEAARALRELADLRFGRPEARAALRRAAELFQSHGAAAAAAEALREADRAGDPAALAEAARTWRAAHVDPEELEVLLELERRGELDADSVAALERLRPLASAPSWTATFDQPLDPRWEIEAPFGVHRDRARRALAVEAVGTQVLARLPLEWDGGWLDLEVELELERAEWGQILSVEVVPRGVPVAGLGMSVLGQGGGELVEPRTWCRLGDGMVYDAALPQRRGVGLTTTLRRQPDGRVGCRFLVDGVVVVDGFKDAGPLPEATAWDLVLRAEGQPGSVTTATVRRIGLRGATPGGPVPAAPSAAFLLADGDPSAVPDDAGPLLVAAAAADRGDRRALLTALDALEGPERAEALVHLLHPRVEWFGEPLRQWLGARYPAEFAAAWQIVLMTHSRRDDVLSAALLGQLEGVEAAVPATPADRDALALLLARKTAVAATRGRDREAVAAGERALALAQDPRFPPVAELGLRAQLTATAVDLAELELRAGRPDGAVTWLRRAVLDASTPLVALDILAARPGLDALRGDPRWSEFASGGLR
jgi:predicted Ser/Thr protein kinase